MLVSVKDSHRLLSSDINQAMNSSTATIKMQALISSAMLFFPISDVWFRDYSVTQTTGAKTMISRSEVDFSRLPTYLHTCKPTVSVVIPYESYIYMGGL